MKGVHVGRGHQTEVYPGLRSRGGHRRHHARPPLALLLLLLGLGAAGCHPGGSAPRPPAESVLRQREGQGLASLLATDEGRSLVRFDDVLVVVDGRVVRDLLAAALPFERVVSRYRLRLTGADVKLEDGFALVRLDGRASLASGPESGAFADVTVYGALDVVDIDPASGRLRGRIDLLAVDVRRVAVLGVAVSADTERLVEELGREKLESFAVLASGLEIPVQLDSAVRIPAVGPEGGVKIEEAVLPLRLTVSEVRALRGKLWVSIEVGRNPASASPPSSPRSTHAPAAPGDHLDELRSRLAARVGSDPVLADALRSPSDVLVGIRPALAQALLREAAARYLDRVELDLPLAAHVDQSRPVEIEAPLLGRVQAGQWRLQLDVRRIRGALRAGTPRLTPAAGNRMHVEVPVVLERAEGAADARFTWNARAVASLVCRDFEVSRRLRGRVLPESYPVAGDFELSAGEHSIVARPLFPPKRYRIHVDLLAESWRELRGAIAEQDRLLRCGMALDPESILPRLHELLREGFEVELPRQLFRPIELPAGVRQSVSIEGREIDLSVSTTDLRLSPDALWYGAAVRSRVSAPPSPASR